MAPSLARRMHRILSPQALTQGRSQGARNVLRAPTPGRYGAGAAAGRKHVCIASLADDEHARSWVPALKKS